MTADSTIDQYHRRRKALLRSILEQRENADITAVYCESDKHCGTGRAGKAGYENAEYHVHHVDAEQSHDLLEGGWQHLYKLEQDVADGVELRVLCKECHMDAHKGDTE